MTISITQKKKAAQKQLIKVGYEFCEKFINRNQDAIIIKSKEPTICWLACGNIGFASISEHIGALSTSDNNSPSLFRLRVNIAPPTALFYQLKSSPVRCKLRISGKVNISTDPILELTTRPEELLCYVDWLVDWLDGQFYKHKTPPKSEPRLIYYSWDEELNTIKIPFDTFNDTWFNRNYLWTETAIADIERYLQENNN